MTRLSRQVLPALLLVVVAAPFALAARLAQAPHPLGPGAPGRDPGCRIATVGPIEVTIADAQKLRAFIAPPPTLPEAARLAVESTAELLAARGHPDEVPADAVRRLVERNRAVMAGRLPAVGVSPLPGTPAPQPGPCAELLQSSPPVASGERLLATAPRNEGTP